MSMANKSIIYTLIIIILFSIFLFSAENNMLVSTQGSLHDWFSTTISIAISDSLYGLDGGLGYHSIRDALLQHGTIDDNIINEVMSINHVASLGVHSSAEVDLGFAYFANLAFYFFGYSVSSLLYFYFIILAGSVILFLIEFRSRDEALVLIVLTLLAYYSTLLVLPNPSIGDGGGTVFTYRFISMLAIVPIFHITLKSITFYENIRNDIYFSNLAVLLQSIIICSVFFIRASSAWIFILALFIVFVNIFFRKTDSKSSVFTTNLAGILKKLFFNKNTPILILFTSLIFIGSLYKFSLSSEYELKDEEGHIFWHSIFLGQATNPVIKKRYTEFDSDHRSHGLVSRICSKDKILINKNINFIPISRQWLCDKQEILKYLIDIRRKLFFDATHDQDGFSAAFKYLSDNNQSAQKLFNFNPEDNVNYKDEFEWFNKPHDLSIIAPETTARNQVNFNFNRHYNWKEHEIILKSVVLDAVKTYPIEIIVNALIVRPIQFISFYFKNYFTSAGWLNNLFILGMLMLLSLSVKSKCNDKLRLLKPPLATTFIFSMITPIVVYPGPHLIADQSVILSTIILFFMLVALVSIRGKIYEFKSR